MAIGHENTGLWRRFKGALRKPVAEDPQDLAVDRERAQVQEDMATRRVGRHWLTVPNNAPDEGRGQ